MMDATSLFQNATSRTVALLILARKEAREERFNYFTPEHILLEMLKDETSLAYRVLTKYEITTELIKTEVLDKFPKLPRVSKAPLPFLPRTKKIIEKSQFEVSQMGHLYWEPEHILLALLREGEAQVVMLMRTRGLYPLGLYKEVRDALKDEQEVRELQYLFERPSHSES